MSDDIKVTAMIPPSLSETTRRIMALILARGRRRNRLGQPRIEFEDLPADLAEVLANAVAASLRQRLPGLSPSEAHLPFGNGAAALVKSRDEGKAVDTLTCR